MHVLLASPNTHTQAYVLGGAGPIHGNPDAAYLADMWQFDMYVFLGYIIPLLFERYERGLEDMAGDESLVAPAKHANLQRHPMDTVLFSPFLIYAAVRAITLPCAIAVTSCTLIKGHWRLVLDRWRSYCKLGRSERHCWISFWEELRHNLVDCRCKRAA